MPILQRQVLMPVLLGHWRLDRLEGLSPDAETARRRTLRFLERLAGSSTACRTAALGRHRRLTLEPNTLSGRRPPRAAISPGPAR